MADWSGIRFTGPLSVYVDGFGRELERQGYTSRSVRTQLFLAAHLSRWMVAQDLLDVGVLAPDVVERFLAFRRSTGYATMLTARSLEPLLGFLHELGLVVVAETAAPSCPAEQLLERYREYVTVERGVCAEAARGYVDNVRPFITGRLSADGKDVLLREMTARDVSDFVVGACPGKSKTSARLLVTSLRSLLRFLHVDGLIAVSLLGAVPSVAGWRLSGLPKALEAPQLAALLDSCDPISTVGMRDLAMLVLMARLGLRRGEVARLTLDDIDWHHGEIVVRGKADRRERLPLPVDVGDAIAAYLQHGRPLTADGRTVFVRVLAPHRALSGGAVTHAVIAAGRRSGQGDITAHRLRHTAATQMLQGGAALAHVAQVLRHRNLATTLIYAKVDHTALRSLARPWPITGDAA